MKFDKYEWQILQSLQKNGRLTNLEIADQIGLSSTPCWRRINELHNNGVIKRYVAILDPQKVGIGEVAFCNVAIDKRLDMSAKAFEAAIIKCPEVLECYASMGDADYLLKVAIPNVSSYDRFLHDVLVKLPGVVNVSSNYALRAIKQDTALPLEVYKDQAGEP